MNVRLLYPTVAFLQLLVAGDVLAAPRYVLRERIDKGGDVLSLMSQKHELPTWTYTIKKPHLLGGVVWSKDRRSLVVFLNTPMEYNTIDLLAWREGEKLKHFTQTSTSTHEQMIRLEWSPDSRALLFLITGSGNALLKEGDLYCLSLKKKKLYHLGLYVRHMHWIDDNEVEYRLLHRLWATKPGGYGNDVDEKQPLYFRLP